MNQKKFRLGSLDHVHIRVPNRQEAAQWYSEYLGFEPLKKYEFWAKGFEGGPLQVSADGGKTMLALFETSEGHPMIKQQTGIAFTLDVENFIHFAQSLPNGINAPTGLPLQINEIVDFDLCWAYNFIDPWGNNFELNCYDYEYIKEALIEAKGLVPVRYWPHELFENYQQD